MRLRMIEKAAVIALIGSALASGTAAGCQCFTVTAEEVGVEVRSDDDIRSTFAEEMKGSEFFIGTVVGLETVVVPRQRGGGEDLLIVAMLEVDELWVGERVWRKEVYTSAASTACGVAFRIGAKFIVDADLIGQSEMQESELPAAASWTNRCRTESYSLEAYEKKVTWYQKFTEPWEPEVKRVQPAI